MSQVVLVTGASSGIGAAVARLLHARGFHVFGTSRGAGATSPGEFEMLQLDVCTEDSVRACLEQVQSRTGRLDVLVNNAGYVLTGAAEETSVEEAKAQFETNFFGVVRMVDVALPLLRADGGGRIINVGSLAGLLAVPFSGFYCASKFALEGYSEALWHELKPLGVTVTLIEPGYVRTGITSAARYTAARLPAYDGPRDRAIAAVDRAVDAGIPPQAVAEYVLRAATSTTPRLRYRVGNDARWLPVLRSLAPWSVFAAGVRRTFALDAD